MLRLAFALAFTVALSAAPGRLIDVGGRSLHLYCTGSGGPTVVLEAAAASGFYSFWEIQPRIPFRTCSYDRAGMGFSDPRPGRRVSAEIAADLHELLKRAGEKPPFVLVGHSLGGLFVRKYAELYPDEVAGMVLLDSTHEDAETLRPPDVAAAFRPIQQRIQAERAKTLEEGRRTGVWPAGSLPPFLPRDLAAELTERTKSERWWQSRHAETEMYERDPVVPAERRRLDMPLVVFTATRWVKLPGYTDDTHAKSTQHRVDLGAELASRSPRSEHIVLDVNHGVHWDAPDAVIAAIARVASPAPGRLVDVGDGRYLHLHCTGSGSPTVILEAGAAEGWYSWHPLQEQLAKELRVCSYDRAGFGYSDPKPGPRTVAGLTEDLHELLRRAGEKPPFVLAGYSLGGELVLRYQARHPEEVAGLVLVDPSIPGMHKKRPAEMQKLIDELNEKRPKQLAEWRTTGKWPEMWAHPSLSESLRREVLQLSASQKWWEARYAEGRMPDAESPVGTKNFDVPLIAIVSSKWDVPKGWSSERPELVLDAVRRVARRSQE